MTTFVVTTLSDTVDSSDGVLSLREALTLAQGTAGADTVTFDSAVFDPGEPVAGRTIVLSQGALEITQAGGPITIDGDLNDDGTADVVLDGNRRSAVVEITGSSGTDAVAALDGLVIQNGVNGSYDPGTGYTTYAAGGGVVITDADVTITHSRIVSNLAGASYGQEAAGAIGAVSAKLTLLDTEVSGNAGYRGAGGIYAKDSELVIRSSHLAGNFGSYSLDNAVHGALKAIGGTTTLVDCDVTGNQSRSIAALGVRGGSLIIEGGEVSGNTSYGYGVAGAGVFVSEGTLAITDATIAGNRAVTNGYRSYGSASGAGLWIAATSATLTRTAIEGNNTLASATGGAGISQQGGALTLVDSRVTANFANGNYVRYGGALGGGIASSGGDLTLLRSLIDNNFSEASSAGAGGISFFGGVLDIRNSTISGNRVRGDNAGGGGLSLGGATSATIVNSTITRNAAERDGPITPYGYESATGGGISGGRTLTLANTILAGNRADDGGQDLRGDLTSNGHNIFTQPGIVGATATDLVIARSELFGSVIGPLGDNGGPTRTHGLLAGSPALHSGDSADAVDAAGDPLLTDQAGGPRIAGGAVDIGAFEGVGSVSGRPPIAAPDTATTTRERPVLIDVLANDSDPGGGITGAVVVAQPATGSLLLTDENRLLYLPANQAPGTVELHYAAIDDYEVRSAGTVTVTVGVPPRGWIGGVPAPETLTGTGQDDWMRGAGGEDSLRGFAGADLLLGGSSDDRLFGGAGDDILIGGRNDDLLVGGDGADWHILDGSPGIDDIRGFEWFNGDRIFLAIEELLTADGALDGERVRGITFGASLQIQADIDGDGTFATLAIIREAFGLSLELAVGNAIA